jgi:uncharacterized protein
LYSLCCATRILRADLLSTKFAAPIEAAPAWVGQAYADFRRVLLAERPPFPCHFGVDGELRDANRYAYVDGETREALPATLERFLEVASQPGRDRMSLVVFVGPPEPGVALEEYRRRFWDLLVFLHERDPEPWPEEVPRDPDDARWEFSFAGRPLFVFGSCPAYRRRRSRNLGHCLVLILQSKVVFAGIGGETRAGRAAKRKIRQRLLAYDAVPPYADLGSADHSSSSKWRQYFPSDDDEEPVGACPFPR